MTHGSQFTNAGGDALGLGIKTQETEAEKRLRTRNFCNGEQLGITPALLAEHHSSCSICIIRSASQRTCNIVLVAACLASQCWQHLFRVGG